MEDFKEVRCAAIRNAIHILEAARGICLGSHRAEDLAAVFCLERAIAWRHAELGNPASPAPVYLAEPMPRPEPDPLPRKGRAPVQGRLVAPSPRGPWDDLFRPFGELITTSQIARLLNMSPRTFQARLDQASFPAPKFLGRPGRGLKHTWLTRDVVAYLNHYSLNGERPPILPQKIHSEAARRRAQSH